jgi:hypothetical protein
MANHPPHVRKASPSARGRGPRPGSALSPSPMIGKEHRSITPTRPTMGVLTLRKVTIPRNLVVHSNSDNDDLLLVRHDAQVDLNPDGARIHYTQEPVLLAESPMSNPPPYIIAGCRTGVGLGNY